MLPRIWLLLLVLFSIANAQNLGCDDIVQEIHTSYIYINAMRPFEANLTCVIQIEVHALHYVEGYVGVNNDNGATIELKTDYFSTTFDSFTASARREFVAASNVTITLKTGPTNGTLEYLYISGTFYLITPTSSTTVDVSSGSNTQVCHFSGIETTSCFVNGTDTIWIQTNELDEELEESVVVYQGHSIQGIPEACLRNGHNVPVKVQAPATLVMLKGFDSTKFVAVVNSADDAFKFETRVLYCSSYSPNDPCSTAVKVPQSTKTRAIVFYTDTNSHSLKTIDFTKIGDNGRIDLYASGLPLSADRYLYSYWPNSSLALPQTLYGKMRTFVVEPHHEIEIQLQTTYDSEYTIYGIPPSEQYITPGRKGFFTTLGYPPSIVNPNTDARFEGVYRLRMNIVNGTIHNGTKVTIYSWNVEGEKQNSIHFADEFRNVSLEGKFFAINMIVTDVYQNPHGGVLWYEFENLVDGNDSEDTGETTTSLGSVTDCLLGIILLAAGTMF